ncbi:hypothetical protein V496_00797 [Pseudogymnoascus sp. VKM F-4515 (FW-2607)]|nr:hypothetical protein V496_00797 [Pseudogymnoascus sp. VKM F-4515 (FW-2607)]
MPILHGDPIQTPIVDVEAQAAVLLLYEQYRRARRTHAPLDPSFLLARLEVLAECSQLRFRKVVYWAVGRFLGPSIDTMGFPTQLGQIFCPLLREDVSVFCVFLWALNLPILCGKGQDEGSIALVYGFDVRFHCLRYIEGVAPDLSLPIDLGVDLYDPVHPKDNIYTRSLHRKERLVYSLFPSKVIARPDLYGRRPVYGNLLAVNPSRSRGSLLVAIHADILCEKGVDR